MHVRFFAPLCPCPNSPSSSIGADDFLSNWTDNHSGEAPHTDRPPSPRPAPSSPHSGLASALVHNKGQEAIKHIQTSAEETKADQYHKKEREKETIREGDRGAALEAPVSAKGCRSSYTNPSMSLILPNCYVVLSIYRSFPPLAPRFPSSQSIASFFIYTLSCSSWE